MALEQFDAALLLDGGQLSADRRLRDVAGRGGSGQAPLVGDLDEQSPLLDAEGTHGLIATRPGATTVGSPDTAITLK